MVRRAPIRLLPLLVLVLASAVSPIAHAQAPVITFDENDREMKVAVGKARATLDVFWQAFEKQGPGEEGFALKVRFTVVGPRKDEGEHIWINRLERLADGRIAGRLANVPRRFKGKPGERRVVGPDQISDWMFLRNGKIVGMETMRPLLKRMSPAEADQLRARMERP